MTRQRSIDWAARFHLPTLGALAVVVTVWWLLSLRYGAYVLPSPRAVLAGLGSVLASGEVWRHTGASWRWGTSIA